MFNRAILARLHGRRCHHRRDMHGPSQGKPSESFEHHSNAANLSAYNSALAWDSWNTPVRSAFICVTLCTALLLTSAGAGAQTWTTYVDRDDRFSVHFPGEPVVEEISWDSEYRAVFPARVHRYVDGDRQYSVTVVDYTDSERIHAERANRTQADSLPNYWQIDVLSSIAYAAWQFRQRAASVTYDAWHYIDLVAGHQLQLTNPDATRSFVGIYLHESRLYILEARVPASAPPPGLFQQSLTFLDADGQRVRYDYIYTNQLPPLR